MGEAVVVVVVVVVEVGTGVVKLTVDCLIRLLDHCKHDSRYVVVAQPIIVTLLIVIVVSV